MIKKIYDFLKKILNELEEDDTADSLNQDSFSSNNLEKSNHKVDTEQPMNGINPVNGLISNGGWDIQGNPNGTDFHTFSDNDFGNSFDSDFGNSFDSDFGNSFDNDFGNSFDNDFNNH